MIPASLTGVLMTLLVLGVLIAIHESGHFLAAKSIKVPVRQFAIGFGPRIIGFTWGETECRLNWIPLGGYCAFVDDETSEEDGPDAAPIAPERLLRNRPIWQRTWVVSAGVIFNFVSAWLILFGSQLALGTPSGNEIIRVKTVIAESAAAKAGLVSGDRILKVDGKPIIDFQGFKTALGDSKLKAIAIEVERGTAPVTLNATPDKDGRIGFQPGIRAERRPVAGLGEAVVQASIQQMKFTDMLAGALWSLFTSPGDMLDKTGGPVAIVAMGDQVYQDDPLMLLDFAVILSIELAIINLLPLPALDGGHLVLLAIEKIRRRPLPRRIEERILVSGFMMIMGLGMLLILKDLFTVPGMYKAPPPAPAPLVQPAKP